MAALSVSSSEGLAPPTLEVPLFEDAAVRGGEGSGEYVFRGFKPDGGGTKTSPTVGDGNEPLGRFGEKRLLELRGEHQVAETAVGKGQRGEDAVADAEIHLAVVTAFFDAG